MSYPPDKLCANCNWCSPAFKELGNEESAYLFAKCTHPLSRKPNIAALIHPALETKEPEYHYCESMRDSESHCGTEANWFQWMDQRSPEDVRRSADVPEEPPWIEGKS